MVILFNNILFECGSKLRGRKIAQKAPNGNRLITKKLDFRVIQSKGLIRCENALGPQGEHEKTL